MTNTVNTARAVGSKWKRGWYYLLAYLLFVVFVAGSFGYLALTHEPIAEKSVLGWMPLGWTPSPTACFIWALGLCLLSVVPFYPLMGALVYIATMYGFARYTPEMDYAYSSGLPEWITGITFLGVVLRTAIEARVPEFPRTWVPRLLLALVIWAGIATLDAWVTGDYWPPHPKHHPVRFFNAFVLFGVAYYFLSKPQDVLFLASTLAATIAVRYWVWPDVGLDNDFSLLTAVAWPVVLAGTSVVRPLMGRLAIGGCSVFLLKVIYDTRNRGAGLGVVVAVLSLWLFSRQKVRILLVALPLLFGAGAWFSTTAYWDRFHDQVFQDGQLTGTALSRVEIWKAALEEFGDRPLFGVGPGNSPQLLRDRHRGLDRYVTHNSYLELLLETGIPGLVLYVSFFFAALVQLWKARCTEPSDWRTNTAAFFAASVTAYLAGGLFMSRQDLGLAYCVAGCSTALYESLRLPSDGKVKRGITKV